MHAQLRSTVPRRFTVDGNDASGPTIPRLKLHEMSTSFMFASTSMMIDSTIYIRAAQVLLEEHSGKFIEQDST